MLQPDGKIIAAGWTVTASDRGDFALARYNADGTLDTSFGAGGKVTTDFTDAPDRTDLASAVALQPDGKIVVAGTGGVNEPAGSIELARYDTGGALDTTFGTGGMVTTCFGNHRVYADALLTQPDGRLVVVGSRTTAGSERMSWILVRYEPDGSLDRSFGKNGVVATYVGNGYPTTAALQPDGKIVVSGLADKVPGERRRASALVRYEPDGTLDATFGAGGRVFEPSLTQGYWAIALQPDGKIVVAADVAVGLAIARYTDRGALDPSFGTKGIRRTALFSPGFRGFEMPESILVQPDGELVVVGSAAGGRVVFVRYQADGSLDQGFGENGKVIAVQGEGRGFEPLSAHE